MANKKIKMKPAAPDVAFPDHARIPFEIERTVVKAKSRKLKATYTVEIPQEPEHWWFGHKSDYSRKTFWKKFKTRLRIPYSELPSYKNLTWYQHVKRWIRLKTGFYTFDDHFVEILSNEITREIDKEILENVMADMTKFRKPE
jgi:hypothetical protein